MLRPEIKETKGERLNRRIDQWMLVVALVALVSLILEHGQYVVSPLGLRILQSLDLSIIAIFILKNFVKLALVRQKVNYLKRNVIDFLLIFFLILWLVAASKLVTYPQVRDVLRAMRVVSITMLYIVVFQAYILANLLLETIRVSRHLAHSRFRPAQTLILSYLFIIILGTFLLYAPRATVSRHISITNAFFSATSAMCVTGLIVVPTGTYFSTFGQGVILVLLHLGGLGLMTFVAFFSLIMGRGLALRDRVVMQDILSYDLLGQIGRIIIYILCITFFFEAVGVLLLFNVWEGNLSFAKRLYYSVFHAASAFHNAGLCLFNTSFQQYVSSFGLNLVVPVLIIIGGLGFAVHENLIQCAKGLFRRKSRYMGPGSRPGSPRARLSLQAKIVLITTAILITTGALIFFLLEINGTLSPLPLQGKIFAAFFQSITARTAGFNTVDTSRLANPACFLLIFLMFIGASPGSTGGGIKTSTFVIVAAAVLATLRGGRPVEIYKRTIPSFMVNRAVAVFAISLTVLFISTMLLVISEDVSFISALFEAQSALGTVGLSTGITFGLSTFGKWVIIVTMLTGRIGPLTVVLAIAQQTVSIQYEYPEERVIIG
jgi:potassium uptake TrkH family protein